MVQFPVLFCPEPVRVVTPFPVLRAVYLEVLLPVFLVVLPVVPLELVVPEESADVRWVVVVLGEVHAPDSESESDCD
jgi:hypothetical protein